MGFDKSINKIRELYSGYSFGDVAKSLFVIDLWPPNMLCHIQCTLFSLVFCSLPADHFSKMDKITSYKHFVEFSNNLYALSPSFPMIEDYRPMPDWGDIKVQLGRESFRFFNGSVDDMYDYIKGYELVYGAVGKLLPEITNRDPIEELIQLLGFQDSIMAAVKCPPIKKLYSSLDIGAKSIAPQSFWQKLIEFLGDTDIYAVFDSRLLSRLTMKTGSVSGNMLDSEQSFGEFVMTTNSIGACFINNGESLFPLLPRSGLEVLLSDWSSIFYGNSETLSTDGLQANLTIRLCKYVSDRILRKNNIELVSAVSLDTKILHDAIFTNAIIAEDRIILPYVLPPCILARKDADAITKNAFEKIKEAVNYMNVGPFAAASHVKRGIFTLKTLDGVSPQKVTPLIILPNMSLGPMAYGVHEEPPSVVMSLTYFLAIIDEVSSANELASFFDFLENADNKVFAPDYLDLFAIFKEGHGVIIDGATMPNTNVWLDATWGVRFRFESLASFWKEYPDLDIPIIDDCRVMAIRKEKVNCRIYARNDPEFNFILIKSGSNTGWVSSPFEKQDNAEDCQISLLLMDCVGDYLNRLKFATKHRFFTYNDGFHIHIFPKRMVEASRDFSHLTHLLPRDGELWRCDGGFPKADAPGGIRVVVDVEALINVSSKEATNRIELDLIKEILCQAERLYHDRTYGAIIKRLDQIYGGKPRFPIIGIEKEVSYPEHAESIYASAHDHKQSRKTIAEIASKLDIKPGIYAGKVARDMLNVLKKTVVDYLNDLLSRYDYAKSIPGALSIVEANLFNYNRKRHLVTASLGHDVDYDRGELLGKDESDFMSLMKCGRYLIEKLVQLKPKGSAAITRKDFCELLALIDKIFEIQGASDVIQYEIGTPRIKISRDFVVSVSYSKQFESNQTSYAAELARVKIGEIGIAADIVEPPPEESSVFFNELDKSFANDFGFRITLLVSILGSILAKWALHDKSEEKTSYSASKDKVIDLCLTLVNDDFKDRSEIENALEFLVLDDVLKIDGEEDLANDLPIWEHNKRHNRYGIRPIIKINDSYYWGANSAESAARIWFGAASIFEMPSNIGGERTKEFLKTHNTKLDNMLEDKAEEIARRYTKKTKKNLNYGKTHPQSVGEYDVLAYLDEKNILLNIECKDIKPPYCHKDAKRVREKIYGKIDSKNQGYLAKVEKREDYLRHHLKDFDKVLKWNIRSNVKVLSVFVTRYSYWWTKFPVRATDARFIQINLLDDLIKKLSSSMPDP